ncbi:hypothetical protein PVAP13_5NG469486 [Panicum virgatum]|uniref:Uncharacterized protein n=1 Tax=Panicum virgatum TaxID=38727 RepID=A0A8T0S2M9_PANVG|nr:hypothetical protein PVAP13_5NG469486 [Panicum virgatum]
MAFSKHLIKMNEASLHPPSLVSPEADDAEIPWVLLDHKAYVADRCNDTTAVSYSRCGKQIQVSFFAARPPRVSYLCVFSRCPADARKGDEEEIIPIEPQVIATDDNLVLLRIIVCPEETLFDGADLYIYRPAGDGGTVAQASRAPP